MSTAFNRRRGAKANRPHAVRVCMRYVVESRSVSHTDRGIEGVTLLERCGAAVSPDRNGNDCGEHAPICRTVVADAE